MKRKQASIGDFFSLGGAAKKSRRELSESESEAEETVTCSLGSKHIVHSNSIRCVVSTLHQAAVSALRVGQFRLLNQFYVHGCP